MLASAALWAAPTGYIMDTQSGQELEHTNNTKLWYAHGRWWGIAQDSSSDDWFLYQNDGPVPGSPGTQGGWTNTSVNIDNRNSTRIDLWYNEADDVVLVLRMHSSGGTYNEYIWDSLLDHYVYDAGFGDVPIPGATREASPCIAQDSTGQVFIAYDVGGVVTLEYSRNPSRKQFESITMDTGAPSDLVNRTALMPFPDSVDGPQMGLLYYAAGGSLTFRRHDDDAGDTTADWASETVDVSMSADDHVCLRSNGQTGDVFAVVRTDLGAVNYYRRPTGGGWSPPTTLVGEGEDATRPQLVVEEDNNEVYVFWTDFVTDAIVYSRSPAGTVDFSIPLEVIGNDNLDAFNDVQTPKHGVTCATDLMVWANTSGATWYNPLQVLWYLDTDGDQYGDTTTSIAACSPPAGYVRHPGDCDETDAGVNPGAIESCDGVDNDCNGVVDDGGTTWYRDADGDGYGDPTDSQVSCTQPAGFILAAGDCDDGDATINPDGTEVCDGEDNDCDGMVDEEDGSPPHVPWYRDADGDGFGDIGDVIVTCAQPPGYVLDSNDCDDTDPAINPNAVEVADGVDNDCNGLVDDLPQPIGYILAPESGQELQHTNNTKLWHAHGRWWCIAQDTSTDDWFLFENDGAIPAMPGTQGGWTQTSVNVDSRNTALIDLWYNETEDVVHVLRFHDNGGTYNEYVWNAGLNRYEIDGALGDVSLPGATRGSDPCIAVDSTGQAFVARDSAGVITVDHSTDAARSSWTSYTLATGAPPSASTRAALIPYNDAVDGGQLGLLYFSAADTLTFARHDDDAGDGALDWTSETVDSMTQADDHVCLRASRVTGDVFAIVRTNPGDVDYYRRPAGGAWGLKTTLASGALAATRPQLVVDETNNEVYAFWTDWTADTIVYSKSPADTTGFSPVAEIIAYPGIDQFDDVQTPKTGVTRTSGLMVVADGQNATWYNRLEIGDIRLEFTGKDTLQWQGGPSNADAWNVYRGDLAVLKQTGVYSQAVGSNPRAAAFCGLSTPDVTDTDTPPSGQVDFYLTTGVVGSIESGLGETSDGAQRPHDNPCP